MKAVVVLELQHKDLEEVLRTVGFMREGFIPSDPIIAVHAAVDEHADWVTDVFLEPVKGGGNHHVVWGSAQHGTPWVIEHSLACRRSGEMHDCPIHRLVHVGVDAGHFLPAEPGTKLKVTLDGSGALLWEP